MSCAWLMALRSIVSSARAVRSSVNEPARSRRVHPSIAFSGLRSSWLTIATKSSLARLADSAALSALSARARSAFRSSSACLRSVMSKNDETTPEIFPSASKSGCALTESHTTRPSGR